MAETKIAYPRHWFVVLAVVFESVLVYLFLAALLNVDSIWRDFWLVLCPIVGAGLFLVLVPPIFTAHSVGKVWFRLRMGLLIDDRVALDAIAQVKETSATRGGLRIGIGVRYVPITRQLFVTSGFSNLISLKLGEAVTVGRLRKRPVEEIILNVTFPTRLLEELGRTTESKRGG